MARFPSFKGTLRRPTGSRSFQWSYPPTDPVTRSILRSHRPRWGRSCCLCSSTSGPKAATDRPGSFGRVLSMSQSRLRWTNKWQGFFLLGLLYSTTTKDSPFLSKLLFATPFCEIPAPLNKGGNKSTSGCLSRVRSGEVCLKQFGSASSMQAALENGRLPENKS